MIKREGSDFPLGQLILTLEAQPLATFIVIQRHNTAVLKLMLQQQVGPQHVLYLRER